METLWGTYQELGNLCSLCAPGYAELVSHYQPHAQAAYKTPCHILALAVLFYESSSHTILSRLWSGNFNLTPGHESALFITLFQNWPFFSNLHLITDKPNRDTESISFSAQPEPQDAPTIPTF